MMVFSASYYAARFFVCRQLPRAIPVRPLNREAAKASPFHVGRRVGASCLQSAYHRRRRRFSRYHYAR